MDDNLQAQAIAQQIQNNPQMQGRVNPGMVQTAWKGAKDMAQQNNIDPNDPDYWNKVTQQTKQSLGIFPDESEQSPKTGEGSQFGFKPAPTPVTAPTERMQPKPVFEAYRGPAGGRGPYAHKTTVRKGPRDAEEGSESDQAYNAELARKRKEQALAKKQAKKAPEKKQESNAYDRGGILFQPGNPVEPTGTRDPFEWELSSTKYLAKAMILLRQRQFEVRFEVLTNATAKWPMEWRFLKPHGVNSVLRITINQLNANPNGMTTSSISNVIDPSYASDVIKTMGKVMKSYIQIWKKSNYQIIVMSTDNGRNVPFILELGKELAKIPSFKLDPELQAQFCDPYINLTKTKGLYVVLKNTSAPAFKEAMELTDPRKTSGFPERWFLQVSVGDQWQDRIEYAFVVLENVRGQQLLKIVKGMIDLVAKNPNAQTYFRGLTDLAPYLDAVIPLSSLTKDERYGFLGKIGGETVRLLRWRKPYQFSYRGYSGPPPLPTLGAGILPLMEAQLREILVDEETNSSAFSATPENASNPYTKGKTGPQINSDANDHLERMKKRGFGAQLE